MISDQRSVWQLLLLLPPAIPDRHASSLLSDIPGWVLATGKQCGHVMTVELASASVFSSYFLHKNLIRGRFSIS